MSVKVFPVDCILDDNQFLSLGFDFDGGRDSKGAADAENGLVFPEVGAGIPVFDVSRALDMFRKDSSMAARFLSLTEGNGTIYWAGSGSSEQLNGRSAGVRVIRRQNGVEVAGDNEFGKFLEKVRYSLRRSVSEFVVNEEPVGDRQVVYDFRQAGAVSSEIEERERAGERFIHVDVYRPGRFRFDTGLDGTTGHAGRESDDAVPFHRFVCPFGTSYPSPIIVGSAAEASILYEQALRGELDWKGLFAGLKQRNLLDSKLTEGQINSLISDYSAQFKWMRQQIVEHQDELVGVPVVGASALVPDSSMGRSVYDAKEAPSPAHVLARYINNPILLFMKGENGVLRSISMSDKHEPETFSAAKGDVNILLSGSDTIGGRVPGRKATQETVRRQTKDEKGNTIIVSEKRFIVPQKTKQEVEADYVAFSARMDSILAGLGKDANIRFVTGNTSTLGKNVGLGTPRMLERYVTEHGGAVATYDFSRGEVVARKDDAHPVKNPGLSVVLMDHFAECLPVLSGRAKEVSFRLNDADENSEVVFRDASLAVKGAVCFSSSEDTGLRNVLSASSYVAGAGLPVIHVQDIRSEEQQREALRKGALVSLAGFPVEFASDGKLFEGELRKDWDFASANHMSMVDDASGLHFPIVAQTYRYPAIFDGRSYTSPMGLYMAMALSGMYGDGAKSEEAVRLLDSISAAEGNSTDMVKIYESLVGGKEPLVKLSPSAQEEYLRKSIRMIADKNSSFAESLRDLDDRDVVISCTAGAPDLFVGADGKGENRFGLALAAERDSLKQLYAAQMAAEEQERRNLIENANKRQKLALGGKAEGQKVKGGLPQSIEEAKDAVWFIGTNAPVELSLRDGDSSFEMWDDMNGEDVLVREKVARPFISDGTDDVVPNNYVYLFPTDLGSVTGRTRVPNNPNGRNLTGVTRVDPETGESYVAAYGIPVRFDNKGNENFNADNAPCSYRMDNDVTKFTESVVLADSLARTTAIKHGLALILPGRSRENGTVSYTLGQVFMPKKWSPKDKAMVDNPHQSPSNLAIVESYIAMLEGGKNFPLNCIPLARGQYLTQDDAAVRAQVNEGKRFISAEGRFIADLMLSLNIANATAIALGVPLRFPLDKDGHIDLGPGVPAQYRMLAERRIDSFIGVKHDMDIADGSFPKIDRVPLYELGPVRDLLTKAGTDLYIRPNDLVAAFGPYDFSSVINKAFMPLHEMVFRMEDGTIFSVKDSKNTRSMKEGEIEKYLTYSKNDERRFIIRTTDPEKVDLFISTLKMYCEKAKAVTVQARLVTEAEVKDQGLEGFVNLLSSNSDEFATSEHDIGREMTAFNATSRVHQERVHNTDGSVSIVSSVEEGRDIDGGNVSNAYYGKVDANDGFRGYAQLRYVLPDGSSSDWFTIENLDLAKDTVMSLVSRKYRSDHYEVPPMAAMELLWKAEAVKKAGDSFVECPWTPKRSETDDKVVEIERMASQKEEAEPVVDSQPVIEDAPVVEAPVLTPVEPVQVQDVQDDSDIEWSESRGGYAQRTRENANADDVDFTLAFAVDFSTSGERCTEKAAGDSYIGVEVSDLSDADVKKAVDKVVKSLPDEYLKGEPMGVNIAGNGIYTLGAHGIDQNSCDEFMVKVLSGLQAKGIQLVSVRSGGQTGFDEASLVAAKACGVKAVCHAPKGWLYRDASGKDISGKDAFQNRFDSKDWKKLGKLVKPKASKGRGRSVKHTQS